DQQDEEDRKLIDQQSHVDLPSSASDPGVERDGNGALSHIAAEQGDEVGQTDGEGDQRGSRTKEMAPAVSTSANEQQDRGTDRRDSDQQPGPGEKAGCWHGRDGLEWGHRSPLE